jgi:hypothetical protein
MKAIVHHRYGTTDVLELIALPASTAHPSPPKEQTR